VELILIRHALPIRVENPDGTPADPRLADEGRAQVERLVRWLEPERIDALYSSPLRRAHETAEPLARARGLELAIEPGVAEFDRDASEYVPLEELKRTDYARWREMVQGAMVAAVDIEAFRYEVVTSLERIAKEHSGQRVVVVCHGGVVNAWTAHVLGLPHALFFEPDYTSLHRFLCAGTGERSVVSLNETAHLRVG
jgi:probable phosphoglycerate mutase